MKSALLVVDVQKSFDWVDDSLDDGKKKVAETLRQVLRDARENATIIPVFIKKFDEKEIVSKAPFGVQYHIGEGCIGCGGVDPFPAFLEHRHGNDFEPVFLKGHMDAFRGNGELEKFLREKKIKDIFLAGCFTFSCVLETARGAYEAGFNVRALRECVFPQLMDNNNAHHWVTSVTICHPPIRKRGGVTVV